MPCVVTVKTFSTSSVQSVSSTVLPNVCFFQWFRKTWEALCNILRLSKSIQNQIHNISTYSVCCNLYNTQSTFCVNILFKDLKDKINLHTFTVTEYKQIQNINKYVDFIDRTNASITIFPWKKYIRSSSTKEAFHVVK